MTEVAVPRACVAGSQWKEREFTQGACASRAGILNSGKSILGSRRGPKKSSGTGVEIRRPDRPSSVSANDTTDAASECESSLSQRLKSEYSDESGCACAGSGVCVDPVELASS